MSLPAIVTRLVGLWILAGAFLKLFQGSPADLPQVLRDLPLDTGLVFKLAITGEMIVGFLAVLRPSRGWLPVKLVTLAFLIVLVTQIMGGEESCGCFGAAVTISPVVMLIIDAVAFLALVLVKPWKLEPGKDELPWLPTLIIIAGCCVLPWVIDNQKTVAEIAEGDGAGSGWVELKWDTYKGKALKDTELWPLLEGPQRIPDGAIIFWSPSCDVCAELLDFLDTSREYIVLLKLPKFHPDDEDKVHKLPNDGNVMKKDLPEAQYVDVIPPLIIEVEGGIVTEALQHDIVENIDLPARERARTGK